MHPAAKHYVELALDMNLNPRTMRSELAFEAHVPIAEIDAAIDALAPAEPRLNCKHKDWCGTPGTACPDCGAEARREPIGNEPLGCVLR